MSAALRTRGSHRRAAAWIRSRHWLPGLAALWWLLVAWPVAADEAAPGSAILILGAGPGTQVYIDGAQVAELPHAGPIAIPAGAHALRLVRLGYSPFVQDLQVPVGRVLTIEAEQLAVAGVLRLRSEPPGATVTVDDQTVGQTPCVLELQPGPRTVTLRLEGYYKESFSLPVTPGDDIERPLTLRALPAAINPNRPVQIKVKPWYTRPWVWPVIIGGTAILTTAIVVPAVLATRSDCDRIGAEVCFPITTGK